jgi:hypothetical protein
MYRPGSVMVSTRSAAERWARTPYPNNQIPLLRQSPPATAPFTYALWDFAQTPDRLLNSGLRSVPDIIAGVNSRQVLDLNQPGGLSRGSFLTSYFDPHQPTSRAHQWNLTLEREIWDNTVVKVGYVGSHAIEEYQKTGWSNSQNFQFEIQRRNSRGYGLQFYYVMSNTLKAGSSGWEDDRLPATNVFLPGAVPEDNHERAYFRLNIDFVGVLNMPGIPKTPDSYSGFLNAMYSGNSARALQFGLRLVW